MMDLESKPILLLAAIRTDHGPVINARNVAGLRDVPMKVETDKADSRCRMGLADAQIGESTSINSDTFVLHAWESVRLGHLGRNQK